MPLENFKTSGKKGVFACFAGRDRLALLPDTTVWGCYLFYDLLGHNPEHPDYEKYCFGNLSAFIGAATKNQAVAAHYTRFAPGLFFHRRKRALQPVPRTRKLRRLPGHGRAGHVAAWRHPRLDLPRQTSQRQNQIGFCWRVRQYSNFLRYWTILFLNFIDLTHPRSPSLFLKRGGGEDFLLPFSF